MQRINTRMFRPNLVECWLEERLVPATPNLGVIVGTTLNIRADHERVGADHAVSGHSNSAAGSLGGSGGSSSTAAAVSGGRVSDRHLRHGQSRHFHLHTRQLHGQSEPRWGGRRGRRRERDDSVGSGADDASAAVAPR